MVKIQLETGYLDVKEGTNFPLNFQVGDIRDLTQRKGTFSKTITLIGSKNNNTLLNNYYDVNVQAGTFDINKRTKCTILQNEIPIVTDALLQLVNVKKIQLTDAYEQSVEYEVLVRDSQAEFYTEITNKELTDLDFSDCNHDFSVTAITDSWNNTQINHYKYLMPYNDSTEYTVNHFKPAIYAKSYFDRIFANAGFTYEWSQLENARFDKLLIPYNGDVNNFDYSDYRVTSDTTYTTSFIQPTAGKNQGFLQTVYPWTETLDTQNIFDPILGQYNVPFDSDSSQGQTYFFNFTYDYQIYLDNTSGDTANLKGYNQYTNTLQDASLRYTLAFRVIKNGVINPYIVLATDYVDFNGTSSNPLATGITNLLSASGTTQIPIPQNTIVGDYLEIQVGISVQSPLQQQIQGVLTDSLTWYKTTSGTAAQVNPEVSLTSLNVEIVPSNNIQVVGGVQFVNEFIPKQIKQSDFVKAIFQMYNLYAYPDTNQPNKLILVHRDEWYDSGIEKDWTRKLAKNQEQDLIFLPDLQNKKLKLTYKEDKDTPNVVYTQATAEIYGQLEYTFENEYVKDTDTKELLFSPTPVNKTNFGAYLPMINGIAPKTNIRILYDGGLISCQPFNIYEYETTGAIGLTSYPQTGHFDNALTPTFDLNFGVCDYYFYQTNVLTNNNLYNLYWRRTVNQINVGKMLTASFLLNEADIQTLKLNDKIRIDNSWWNINKIIDYNANDEVLTKVELISIDTEIDLADFKIKNPRFVGDNLWSDAIKGVNLIKKVESNINLSTGYFDVYGNGNVIGENLKGIAVGDNLTVNESGITTKNLTVTETINGNSIDSVFPSYKKYIALISQYGVSNDPTVDILENTLGDVQWSYRIAGGYKGDLTNAFANANKVYLFINQDANNLGGVNYITRYNSTSLHVDTFDSTGTQADNLLYKTTIEIRVYP